MVDFLKGQQIILKNQALFPHWKMGQCNNQPMYHDSGKDAASVHKHQIGENVSRKDKINFLVTTVSINLENLR
ncbi:hypothetical protein CK203_062817 [Vitis vinifera]|uniref:Uncharacterized protein n=1 Tax=Vitis vinifera TaxID=29760 RepID=A0A438GBD0_VITVI|nr:hypothetical protein CK203_062817 [Vitis vinifera]